MRAPYTDTAAGTLRYARAPRPGLLRITSTTDQITAGLSLRLDERWGSRHSGRLLEGRKQLILQKGQAYADYLRALANAAIQEQSKETLALATDAKTRICIYGAADVISRLATFGRVGARIESEESRKAVAAIIEAMRRDMGASRRSAAEADLRTILFGPTIDKPGRR